jgi:hypothetical protein
MAGFDLFAMKRDDSNSRRALAPRGAMRPGIYQKIPHPLEQRAHGNAGCRCTRSLAREWVARKCARVFTASSPESSRHSRTRWLYSLCRDLPGDRALLPPSSRRYLICPARLSPTNPPRDLTPASRCQDHSILLYARLRRRLACLLMTHGEQSALSSHRTPDAARVHRIPSRVRDDRDTPLVWDETAVLIGLIWISENQNIFRYGTRQARTHQI